MRTPKRSDSTPLRPHKGRWPVLESRSAADRQAVSSVVPAKEATKTPMMATAMEDGTDIAIRKFAASVHKRPDLCSEAACRCPRLVPCQVRRLAKVTTSPLARKRGTKTKTSDTGQGSQASLGKPSVNIEP